MTASPEPGNRDEREAEVVRQWLHTHSQVPKGHCSAPDCWYTLPLVDGLIVAHSAAGTVEVCDGGGRPPLAAAAADQGEGGEADDHTHVDEYDGVVSCVCSAPSAGQNTERLRDETLDWIARFAPMMPRPLLEMWTEDFLDGPLRQLIAERDEARALATWLIALGDDEQQRRTVTLAQIIDRARRSLDGA